MTATAGLRRARLRILTPDGCGDAIGQASPGRHPQQPRERIGAGHRQRSVYFLARLPPRYPTVEVRVADVCRADSIIYRHGKRNVQLRFGGILPHRVPGSR